MKIFIGECLSDWIFVTEKFLRGSFCQQRLVWLPQCFLGIAFVIGDAVQGGLYGEYPSLAPEKLLEGDLHYNNDFRSTYATLLEKWLGLDAKAIVGGSFEQLAFL